MQLHNLNSKTRRKHPKLIGRGGKRGKTSGRGGKGQTARAGAKLRSPLREIIKRLPKRRGFGSHRASAVVASRPRPAIVNLKELEAIFADSSEVTPQALREHRLIRGYEVLGPVKILGEGGLSKKLFVSGCLVSGQAREKIEKAGGTIKS